MCDEKDWNFGATTTGSSMTMCPPTSLKTTEFVPNNNMVILPHPPYFPDLDPYDFALFPKLKMKLKRRCFETMSDIQRKSEAVFDSIKENDFMVFLMHGKNDGITAYIPNETPLKEIAAKLN
jgi:hypothetical protein